jgi:hypothetical protein
MEECDGNIGDGHNRSTELAICKTFFDTLTNISSSLVEANKILARVSSRFKPLILSVDAGTSWSCPEDDQSDLFYCCDNCAANIDPP